LSWLKQLWRSPAELEDSVVKELQDRTWQCQQTFGKHWVYMPQGDLRNIEGTLYEPRHCVLRYGNRRSGNAELPRWQEFDGAPMTQEGDTDEVAQYLSKVAQRHHQRVRVVQSPKRRGASADPSAAPLDADLSAALLSSPATGQRLLYNYFRGVGSAPGGKDLLHDWRDSMGVDALPPSSCGTGLKMKLHQATVYSQMRMWAAAQGSGARFEARAAPKGFLAFHSTGSGKTCLASAVYQAFWDQTLPSGAPRPLMLFTTPANRDRIRGESPCEEGAKRGGNTDTVLYYTCSKSMFPSSQVARMSASEYDKRVKAYSFTQAGNRLRGSSKDSAEFVRRIQQAVIVIDEAQSIFAPEPQFKAQAELLRDWLLSAQSDGATVVIMTATPGRTVPELFELLQSLRRSDETRLSLAHFASADGTLASSKASEFRRAMAGRVSFVDYRNNTNDYPVMRTDVQVVEMSPEQRKEWQAKVNASKNASLENAAQWASTEGNRMRRESNMAKSWSNTKAFSGRGSAKDVYASGDLRELHKYSAKLVRLVQNLESPASLGKKQYVYSAFTIGGLTQITAVLQGRGWVNVYSHLSTIGAALHEYECGGKTSAQLAKLERALQALPGKDGRRFLSTVDWSSAPPKSASPQRALRGGAPRARSPRAARAVVVRDEEPDAPEGSAHDSDRRAKAEAKVQSLAMKVFNSVDNTYGRFANLLLATGKYNEGLDLRSVRVMHMFEPQTSLASEKQMEGRGRRYCSHTDLPPAERDVDVIHYFSEVHGEDRDGLVNDIKDLQAEARRQEGIAKVLQERVRLGRADMRRLVEAGTGLEGGVLKALQSWLWGPDSVDSESSTLRAVTEDEVRLARLADERLARRLHAAQQQGERVPVSLQVEAALAKDRRTFLEGLRGHSAPLKSALERLKKRAESARTPSEQRRAAEDAHTTVQVLQGEEARMLSKGDEATALARQYKAAAATKIAELKKLDPALLELLDEYAPGDAQVHDSGPLATDSLVHGVARLEAAPMASFLQALSDSATDCMVLQALHARMGVRTDCRT